jgi:tagatose-6-phosphate ketose/aldose isomerase
VVDSTVGRRTRVTQSPIKPSTIERALLDGLWTAKEIFQQPETWLETCERVLSEAPRLRQFVARLNQKNIQTILLVGAGSSAYAAESLGGALSQKFNATVLAVPSTDLLSEGSFPRTRHNHLCISLSRSAQSPECVAVIEKMQRQYPELPQLLITCNRDTEILSKMAPNANFLAVVLSDATNDRSLAMTSSFTNMEIAGQCLANLDAPDDYRSIARQLSSAAIDLLPRASQLASSLSSKMFGRTCFLGSGSLHAVAKESALKVLELTAGEVVSFSETFLGLRHGPLAAINRETLVVGLLSSEIPKRAYEIDLLREIRRKDIAGTVLAIGFNASQDTSGIADEALDLAVEGVPDNYLPPVSVIFGQLLGLAMSMDRGFNPDSPSKSGAISRVVPPITIY